MPPFAVIAGWKAFVYANDHGVPHFHLRRADQSIPIAIADGRILSGKLPVDVHRTVNSWLDEHREEALAAWNSIREGRLPTWIE